jgi:hypothetical protein
MKERIMSNKLSDARRSLIRAQESTRQRLDDLESERRELKASLRSLDAALKALGKSKRGRTSRRPAFEEEPDNETAIDAS